MMIGNGLTCGEGGGGERSGEREGWRGEMERRRIELGSWGSV